MKVSLLDRCLQFLSGAIIVVCLLVYETTITQSAWRRLFWPVL